MPHKFAVDSGSKQEDIDKIVERLKDTIRFGKQAEKILNEIETHGHYDGLIKVCVENREGDVGSISQHRLNKYEEPSRDRAPPLSDLIILTGKVTDDSHGGHRFKSVEVKLKGTGLLETENGVTQTRDLDSLVGYARMKKTGLSIELKHDLYFLRYDVVDVPKGRGPNADKALSVISKCIADHVVHSELRGHGYRPNYESQFMNDIRINVQDWLIKEGVVQRICREIHDATKVVEVMNV